MKTRSINIRQLSSLLRPFGIKVVKTRFCEKDNVSFFELWSLDGQDQIGLTARDAMGCGSGWATLAGLVYDICSPNTDAFVFLSPEKIVDGKRKVFLDNPFGGCKTYVEMKIRRDLAGGMNGR